MKICDKKCFEVNDLSSSQYYVNKNIRFKTSMLRSDFCDYSDAYIVVKERINAKATANSDIEEEDVVFKTLVH